MFVVRGSAEVKADVATLKADEAHLKVDVTNLKKEMALFKREVSRRFDRVEAEMGSLRKEGNDLRHEIVRFASALDRAQSAMRERMEIAMDRKAWLTRAEWREKHAELERRVAEGGARKRRAPELNPTGYPRVPLDNPVGRGNKQAKAAPPSMAGSPSGYAQRLRQGLYRMSAKLGRRK